MASKSKAVLISGAAQGIGRCIARTLLQKGHRVFLLDINESELTYTVEKHLKPYRERVDSSLCNLRSVDEIRTAVDKAAKFFGGKIDVVVNNGGIAHPYWKDGHDMSNPDTISQWTAYLETNLTAPFAVSQAAIPYMSSSHSSNPTLNHPSSTTTSSTAPSPSLDLANNPDDIPAGPCIIHIGSFRARQSDPNQEGYASTKAGLLGLTQSMAISCAKWGIRVNLIAPGRIKAKHESKEADEKGEQWEIDGEDDVEPHATNRPGRPSDIAQAVVYLMDAGFVTGHDLTIDGGALVAKNAA